MDLALYIAGSNDNQKDRLVENLCSAIDACLKAWGDDPTYKTAAFKLRQVERELDVLGASPGHRAALRALPPNIGGQEAEERSEPPTDAY